MKLEFIESSSACTARTPPLLTIGIPTWNRESLLQAQLDLLDLHLNDDIEVVVCDNGSTDQTWDVINNFISRTSRRMRVFRNGSNLGADVNYLRVLEVATGKWIWMVGDDDRVDFGLIPEIIAALDTAKASTMLLVDSKSAGEIINEHVTTKQFFAPRYDTAGMHVLQVGRILVKNSESTLHIRSAYATALGHLHSYSAVYGPLITRDGIDLFVVPLVITQESEAPRWNLLNGFLGAWDSSLKMYDGFFAEANRREVRLRQKPLLWIVIGRLIQRQPLPFNIIWRLYRRFDVKGKSTLIFITLAFSLAPKLATRAIYKLKPTMFPGCANGKATEAQDY